MPMTCFPFVAYQIDVARRLEKPETLFSMVDSLGDCGYNACVLYLEDAFAYPRHPRIGREHAYSVEQMKELQARCARHGQELTPVTPALGHAAYITSKEGYAQYDEGRGGDALTGTVSPSFDETYALMRELFEDWCQVIPGNYLHVGLDESPAMGQWARRQGQEIDEAALFAGHCNRLNAIANSLDRTMIIWGDMFYYYPEAIEQLDTDIIVADWYYYPFEETPRVEAYNFAQVDLAQKLKEAGLTVWGCPSLWPNMPIGNLVERWQNVQDWCRYGRERGIDGLLLSDWENSTGFAGNSRLLLHAFGNAMATESSLHDELPESLRELTGVEAAGKLAEDLIALGKHHLTGRDDRVVIDSPLEAWIIPERADSCREHWQACRELLPGLLDLEGKATSESGRRLLQGLFLCHRLVTLSWKLGALLPDYVERLRAVAHGQIDREIVKALKELADEIGTFAGQYSKHWNEVRYRDDPAPVVTWAEGAATKLAGWADLLERSQPAPEHPLFAQARLLCHLRCSHPALPVITLTATWKDGKTQTMSGAMIRFSGDYATPDREWDEYRCFVLDRAILPDRVEVEVNNYGQVGIVQIAVEHRDTRHIYKPSESSGDFVERRDNLLWLGPKGAQPGQPTIRQGKDTATFQLEDG